MSDRKIAFRETFKVLANEELYLPILADLEW